MNVPLISDSQFFEVLIYFPELIRILFESFFKFKIDFLFSLLLPLLFEFSDSIGHPFSNLVRSLLRCNDLIFVHFILLLEQLWKLLPKWVRNYLLEFRLRLAWDLKFSSPNRIWLLSYSFFPLFCHLANSCWWNSCLSLVCIFESFCYWALLA